MPTVNEVLGGLLQNAVAHPKSTIQSILTTTFALTGTLMVANFISPKTAAILAAVNGVAKILLGMSQTDGINVPPNSKVQQITSTTVTTPKA